jgi:acetyl-CoA acyltransferase
MNSIWARRQMEERGATVDQFAAAAVTARRHAGRNPLAQHRQEVSAEEVIGSPVVEAPLTRLMCSSFTDGAAAVVVGADGGAAPIVRASVMSGGDGSLEYHDRVAFVAGRAWSQAGIGPRDLDVVETHDATAAEGLYSLENLGVFEPGEAGPATLAGETTFGAGTVVNPSGGLLARGHPLGATGLCQVVELADQLRGRAGARQVEGARIGAAVNTGGIISGDSACTVVHVLERA